MNGTKLLDLKAIAKVFKKGKGLSSMYGSTKVSDDFNVANAVYKQASGRQRLHRSVHHRGGGEVAPSGCTPGPAPAGPGAGTSNEIKRLAQADNPVARMIRLQ